ncbi:Suppressor of disruption of TFIIS [Fusarium oxysporum f. sp. rapae]|uniref:Suppressor of disruption of TFIIS n=1 Tax=Fusarium oxysporum f. sp. rapae TaxID=485398 RepID=A0A8J5PL27_FUSOX|nr:Suppressor of disruption of TFIIS [Fusarium oxysporum f. sp. rapae]
MDQASEKPVLFFDIDNCLYSRNDKVLEHMSKNIDDYFKKNLGLSPDDAERLHKDYSQQYGQAIEGLVRHHQIDALEYNAKVDDAVPLDDLIKPNPQLRQFLEDIDTSKVRLWLLTNAYVNHGKRVVRLLGVDDLFEGLTYCDYSQIPFVFWIQGNNFDDVKLSGVAAYAWNDPDTSSFVPFNSRGRYDDRNDDDFPTDDEDEPEVEISITNNFVIDPPPDWRWGFLFHDVCWSLLNFEEQVELQVLFHLCVSSPVGPELLLNFGHDYGGAAAKDYQGGVGFVVSAFRGVEDVDKICTTNPLEIPALEKAINFSARMQQDAFQSILDRSAISADKDVFNYLPPEILETIVTFLPPTDVHSLRLASRVFATLSLSERFWVSRFTSGHEFDYLPDVFSTPPDIMEGALSLASHLVVRWRL